MPTRRTFTALITAASTLALTAIDISSVEARNTRSAFNITPAMAKSTGGADRVDRTFPVVFARPAAGAKLAAIRGHGKAHVAGIGPEEACSRAFRDALIQMQGHARSQGAAAVGDIVSAHTGERMASGSTFLCGVGNVQVVVDLEGNTYGMR